MPPDPLVGLAILISLDLLPFQVSPPPPPTPKDPLVSLLLSDLDVILHPEK